VTAAVGIVGSVISLGYYGAVLRSLYQATPSADVDAEGQGPLGRDEETAETGGGSAAAVVIAIAVLTVAFGLLPLWTGIPRIWALFS